MMPQAILFHKQLGDLVLLQPALARLSGKTGQPVGLSTRPAFEPVLELLGKDMVKPGAFRSCGDLYVFERGSKAAWKAWRMKAQKKHLVLSEEREKKWFHRVIFHEVVFDSTSKDYRARYYWNHVPGKPENLFTAPRLHIPPPAWRGRYPEFENHVLIHPTSAWKRKCWTVEKWRQSLEALATAGLGPFLVTSGPDAWEVGHAAEVARGLGNQVACLAGKTSLRELISLIHRSRLVLAVDGAVAHLAAALERPSVVLFGPANPLHWHYPTGKNLVLSARDYTPETRPAAGHIPSKDLVEKALALCG